ncbi:MAG: hypothetical protein NTY59_07710 [Alphaproteobacteria bacterium]|nr:hypothetical protein [Alphaproteobacteria bacterium]
MGSEQTHRAEAVERERLVIERRERRVDAALEESFPASDPTSFVDIKPSKPLSQAPD